MAKGAPAAKPRKSATPPIILPVDETPIVTLNLWSFTPITTGGFCTLGSADPLNRVAQMSVPLGGDPNQSIGLYQTGGLSAPAGGVTVQKQALISFNISTQYYQAGTSPYQGPFAFAGLTLVPLVVGANTDNNFSRARWTPTMLQFHVRHGKKGGKWKLYISIIDASTGLLGLIDPEVENDVPALQVPEG